MARPGTSQAPNAFAAALASRRQPPGYLARSKPGVALADGAAAAPAVQRPSVRVEIFGRAPHDFVHLRKALRISANILPVLILLGILLVPLLPKWSLLALIPAGGLLAESVASGRTYCKNMYTFLILPLFYVSALLLPLLPLPSWGARGAVLGAALGCAALRMAIMTVCLHRYAAHAAFRCNAVTNLGLGLLGCLGNQGGPLWWASKHRCHHKFCDGPLDPHSPVVRTPAEAFSFFTEARHEPIDEKFAPRHCDSPGMRIIDAFSSVPVILDHCLAYCFFGVTGLWVAHVSAWMCQAGTLWFNVISHSSPPRSEAAVEGCRAADYFSWRVPSPIFLPLQLLVAAIFPFIGEKAHRHHHDHPGLARRPGPDVPYFLLVWPMEKLGLLRNVVTRTKEAVTA